MLLISVNLNFPQLTPRAVRRPRVGGKVDKGRPLCSPWGPREGWTGPSWVQVGAPWWMNLAGVRGGRRTPSSPSPSAESNLAHFVNPRVVTRAQNSPGPGAPGGVGGVLEDVHLSATCFSQIQEAQETLDCSFTHEVGCSI